MSAYLDLLENVILHSLWPQRKFGGSGIAMGDITEADLETGDCYPEYALTMVGRKRLRNVRDLCAMAVTENVPGGFCECGVWRGGVCLYARACFPEDRTVYVCDSFNGFPNNDKEPWWQQLEYLKVSQAHVEATFRKFGMMGNVKFVRGLFKDSLNSLEDPLAVLRLDGDSYVNTMDCLIKLYPKISPRGFLIVDDYGIVPECKQALIDYFNGTIPPLNVIDASGVWMRKES